MGQEQTERLLDLIIDRLAWLEHHGYGTAGPGPSRPRPPLDYNSASGRVTVSVERWARRYRNLAGAAKTRRPRGGDRLPPRPARHDGVAAPNAWPAVRTGPLAPLGRRRGSRRPLRRRLTAPA